MIGAPVRLARYLSVFLEEEPDVDLVEVVGDTEFRHDIVSEILSGYSSGDPDFVEYGEKEERQAAALLDRSVRRALHGGPLRGQRGVAVLVGTLATLMVEEEER